MSYNKESKHWIILDKPEDWEEWISQIQKAINDPTIWDLINPDIPVKPSRRVFPAKLPRPQPNAAGQFDPVQMDQYKTLRLLKEKDIATFYHENSGLREVNKLIYDTVSPRMLHKVLAYTDSDAWSNVRATATRSPLGW